MELLQPTSFASAVASSKEQLKVISSIVSKYCGQAQADDFLKACDALDFTTANTILDDTVKKITKEITGYDYDSVSIALSAYVDRLPQLSPDLGNKVSGALSEADKVKAFDSYRSRIINIFDGMC